MIGLVLGDTYVRRETPTSHSIIFFEQSIIHKSYLFYIYNIFQNLIATPPRWTLRKPNKITGKIYYSFVFNTLTFLNELHELFYYKGIKLIPHNISDFFT